MLVVSDRRKNSAKKFLFFLTFVFTCFFSGFSNAQQTYTTQPVEGWLRSIYYFPNVSDAVAFSCDGEGWLPGRTEAIPTKPTRLNYYCMLPSESEEGGYFEYRHSTWSMGWSRTCSSGYTAVRGGADNEIVSCELVSDTRPGQTEVCKETGCTNPIMLSSQRKVQSEIDYKAIGSYPLKFMRTYNSGRTGTTGLPAEYETVSYWHHNYSMELTGYLDGSTPVLPGRYTITDEGVVPEPAGSGGGVLDGINAARSDGSLIHFSGFLADANQHVTLVTTMLPNGAEGLLLTTANNNQEYYSFDGKLFATRSQAGETHTLTYAADGQLSKVTDDYGKTLTFSYANDQLVSVTDPAGNQINYTYNEYGDYETVTFPDTGAGAKSRQYLYEAEPRQLTGIIDERGERYTSWSYETDGDYIGLGRESTGPDGINQVVIERESSTRTKTTDSLGLETIYNFSAIGGARVVSSKERVATTTTASATETRQHDNNGFLTSITDWNGNTTTYDRDSRGLATRTTFASGTAQERTILRQWHPNFRLPLSETYPNFHVDYDRDAKGNVLTHTVSDSSSGLSRQWSYTYDVWGKLRTVDGPRNDVSDKTTLTYYNCSTGGRCGQLKKQADALGNVTRFLEYNDHGQLTQMTDPNGLATDFTYDARQRLTAVSTDGQLTSLAYDDTGNVVLMTLPNGTQTQFTWDIANRLVDVQDKAGNTIEWILDKWGNRTSEKMRKNSGVTLFKKTRSYDALKRLIALEYAHGAKDTFTYDDNGNSIETIDGASRSETQTYDALDRLVRFQDALQGDTDFTYDLQDNIASVTDPEGLVTEYTYNGFGDRLTQLSPDTGTTTYTHDEAGNVLTKTDARNVTSNYVYDALNRLVSITYPNNAESISYTYDQGVNGIGRLTQIIDQSGTTQLSYDQRGNVIERSSTVNSNTYTSTFDYNGADQLTSTSYPSGRVISYIYDDSGRIQSVSSVAGNGTTESLATSIERLPFGPVTALTLGNGIARAVEFDKDYRIETLNDENTLSKGYAWNAVNNITAITDVLDFASSQLFSYDDVDRLDFAAGGYGEDDYTYDAIGNRLSTTRDNQQESYQYGTTNHNLQSRGSVSYTYDNAGNTLTGNGAAFEYGDRNRMESVTTGGVTTTYTHNAMGQRVLKNVAGVETHYVYDLDGRVILEADGSGAIQVEYSYLDGMPLAMWSEPKALVGVNLALSGVASQSSTRSGGSASKANDGNTSGVWKQGSVTHTNNQSDPWWEVALAERSAVSGVVLYNRTDCCTTRLTDVHVFISEQPFEGQTLTQLLASDDIAHVYLAGVQGSDTQVPITGAGSYVRVQLAGTGTLSLAEVEVFGVYEPAATNLSLAGSASQSSTNHSGVASRAIDGNTSGVWSQGSVTHTNSQSDPWWEVALAERSAISEVVLYNRTNCCTTRLADVHVFISEQPFGGQTLAELLANSDIAHAYLAGVQGSEVAVPITGSGSYVRVQLAGTGILSLAEVEVFGVSSPPPLDTNLSTSGVATQSSTRVGGVASRAIDGNTSGVWSQGSVTHTNNQSDPWWQLVLSEVSTVNSVVLYNRTDACCTARLTDVHVFISEQPFGDQTLAELLADNDVAHAYLAGDQGSEVEVPITGQGSYVRVQLAGSGTLSLAEVDVFGFGNSALGGQ